MDSDDSDTAKAKAKAEAQGRAQGREEAPPRGRRRADPREKKKKKEKRKASAIARRRPLRRRKKPRPRIPLCGHGGSWLGIGSVDAQCRDEGVEGVPSRRRRRWCSPWGFSLSSVTPQALQARGVKVLFPIQAATFSAIFDEKGTYSQGGLV